MARTPPARTTTAVTKLAARATVGPGGPYEMPNAGVWVNLVMPSKGVATFKVPTLPGTDGRGRALSNLIFGLYETTTSFPGKPWNYEICVSKTPGVVDPKAGDFYSVSGNRSLFEKVIFTKKVAKMPAGACLAPAEDGTPWYINVRFNYARTTAPGGKCGWFVKWNVGPPA